MGRKNRNARRTSYTSFNDLKESTLRFDLSKGSFITKKSGYSLRANDSDDVSVSVINKGGTRQGVCVQFSVKEEIADTMIKGSGRNWACGIVKEGVWERIYLIPDEYGYALYTNDHGKRWYMKAPIEDRTDWDRFTGRHEMKYDNANKAYYISLED